jgi:hypothetical protein
MTPISLNLPGDLMLIGVLLALAAVPVALLRGLYKQQRKAMERDK